MKDSEKLFEAIGDIRDDQIEDAEERSLKPGRARRRFWFGAIAALLAVAMVAGYFAYEGVVLGFGLGAAAAIPGNLIQGVFGLAVSVAAAEALSRSGAVKEL